MCVYQDTADSLRGAGLLTVRCPVQRDLSLAVWNADVGIMFNQKAYVLRPVIKRRPVQSGLLQRNEMQRDGGGR